MKDIHPLKMPQRMFRKYLILWNKHYKYEGLTRIVDKNINTVAIIIEAQQNGYMVSALKTTSTETDSYTESLIAPAHPLYDKIHQIAAILNNRGNGRRGTRSRGGGHYPRGGYLQHVHYCRRGETVDGGLMLVSVIKHGKEILYRSEGTRTIDPFIGRLEELPEFVQTAIAILNMAEEGVLIEGRRVSNFLGAISYHIQTTKDQS